MGSCHVSAAIAPRDNPDREFSSWACPAEITGDIDDLNSEKSYGVMRAHSNTVGGNEALVYEGAERYPYLGVFGLAPGIIKTGIRGHAFGSHSPLWHLMEWLIGLFTPVCRRLCPEHRPPFGLARTRRAHRRVLQPQGQVDPTLNEADAELCPSLHCCVRSLGRHQVARLYPCAA